MTINKEALRRYCESYRAADTNLVQHAIKLFFSANANINVVHPFNKLSGPEEYIEQFIKPLASSFKQLRRTEYIAIGGSYSDGEWIACTGYYSGNYTNPWIGIKETAALAYLRFAEFHRMEQGKAIESYVFLDIPALMMAAGVWPLNQTIASHGGYTGFLPGPATGDGVVWNKTDSDCSESTLLLTELMLQNLATEDEAWRAYWHDHMTWYGPAIFGAFQGIEEFAGFQTPFEQTFSEWISGIKTGSVTKHFTRFADGNYSCLGGWPSLNMIQVKPFLGQLKTNKRVYMRVCDFWRRDGERLAENWVFVDGLDFLLQLDYDVLATLEKR